MIAKRHYMEAEALTKGIAEKAQELRCSFKEIRFAVAFTAIGEPTCGNATKSALEAGCSESSAKSQASKIRRRPRVAQLIAFIEEQYVRSGMFSRQGMLVKIEDTLRRAKAAGDLQAELRALELLGKATALFSERHIVLSEREDRRQQMTASEYELARRAALATYDQLALPPNQRDATSTAIVDGELVPTETGADDGKGASHDA